MVVYFVEDVEGDNPLRFGKKLKVIIVGSYLGLYQVAKACAGFKPVWLSEMFAEALDALVKSEVVYLVVGEDVFN